MSNKAPKFYRQGDVGITKIDKLPKGAKKLEVKNNTHVLAFGEVTGHSHQVVSPKVESYELDGTLYLKVNKVDEGEPEIEIRHDEHKPIQLEEGLYEIMIQNEYSPQEIRKVVD